MKERCDLPLEPSEKPLDKVQDRCTSFISHSVSLAIFSFVCLLVFTHIRLFTCLHSFLIALSQVEGSLA